MNKFEIREGGWGFYIGLVDQGATLEAWRYLGRGGEILSDCRNGWFKTKKEAQEALDKYNDENRSAMINISIEEQIELAKSYVGKRVTYNSIIITTGQVKSWSIRGGEEFKDFFISPSPHSLVSMEIKETGFCVCLNMASGAAIPIRMVSLVVEPEFYEVKLNNNFKAKVYKDKIEVGCQTFPIAVLKDMKEALDNFKKESP